MLLEDTYDTCIRCGADVTIEENISLYPPEIMDTIDAQAEERKKRLKITALIIAIFVALVGLIAVAAVGIGNGSFKLAGVTAPETKKVAEVAEPEDASTDETIEEELEISEEDAQSAVSDDVAEQEIIEEEPEEPATRTVNDAKGDYYDISNKTDDADNVILQVITPEDFTNIDFTIDYDVCSTRYPFGMMCVASDEEGGIQFLYMAPKQLWYKLSETGKTRSNERDPSYYMSFYEYGGAKSYIESMLKASYPKGKYECVSEKEISPEVTDSLKSLSDAQTSKLFNDIGDYAHVGDETTYANMDAEFSAYVYEYEITTSDKQLVFDKFYVPIMSNNLYYANEKYNDRGTVTEWYILGFCVMEAGNEDLYEDYEKAFDIFAQNAIPSEMYMKLNQIYGEEIGESIKAKRAVEPMTLETLKDYTKQASNGYELDAFNKSVLDVLGKIGPKSFTDGSTTIHTGSDINTVYVDKEDNKLFVSTEADEYPGDTYTELTAEE